MNPDHSRISRRPAERPLPPVRTLRGDMPAQAPPAGGWIAPVRSGVGSPPAPPEPAPAAGEPAVEDVPGLQPLAQPLTSEEPALPIGTWTDVADDEAEAELVLEDEVWVSDPDAMVEDLAHGEAIEPIEGLTVAGDVARTEPEPVLDEPPVSAWDYTVARPATEQEEDEQEAWERSGWEVLSRAFSESTPTREPGEEPAPEPDASDAPEILDAAAGAGAEPTPPKEDADPTALASRLERLADRLRMHGSHALDESRDASDPMEAALADALTRMLAQYAD